LEEGVVVLAVVVLVAEDKLSTILFFQANNFWRLT